MEAAVFSLTGYKFSHIELNLEDIPVDTPLTLDFAPKGEYLQEEGVYNLNFTFKSWAGNIKESKPVILVTCIASFKFKDAVLIDEIPKFFYSNSIAILFPYVRAFVSTLTLQANIKPILLPTLNLSSLQDLLREHTTVK